MVRNLTNEILKLHTRWVAVHTCIHVYLFLLRKILPHLNPPVQQYIHSHQREWLIWLGHNMSTVFSKNGWFDRVTVCQSSARMDDLIGLHHVHSLSDCVTVCPQSVWLGHSMSIVCVIGLQYVHSLFDWVSVCLIGSQYVHSLSNWVTVQITDAGHVDSH